MFKQKALIPLFALGMGYQVQPPRQVFFQTPPSAEEIPSDVIEERQDITPTEALKTLPGLVLTGSEVTTYTGSLFLRGADSSHTLFIWNDFRGDDFMAPGGASDPFSYGTEFSNRIRVLKGPQSLIYGTQALGGVVLIDQDPDLESSLELAGGSLNSVKGTGEARARGEKWQLAVGASAFSTDGVSTYNAPVGQGPGGGLEKDGRRKESASVIFSYDLPSEDQLQVMVSGLHNKSDDDVPPLDDVNARSESRGTQWKARYKANWSDRSDSTFLLTDQASDRENRNDPDAQSANYYLNQFQGRRQVFTNRNNLHLGDSVWQVGAEYQRETGDFAASSNTAPTTAKFSANTNDESVYLVNDWNFKNSDFSWGARGNCQENKNCIGVYQLSYQYHWVEAQRSLYGILSTGLKRPTLYQLYSGFGDTNLKSETSQAYEVGVVQRWGAAQRLRLSAFDTHFSNLIDYDVAATKYKNVSKARTQGYELSHQYDAMLWDTQVSFSQLYAKDEDSQRYLLRRPIFQGTWDLGYQVNDWFHLMNEFVYVGDREDNNTAGTQRVTLAAATLWNVVAQMKSPYGNYFLRVNNLGNTFYEDISGYLTPGRFLWLGAKWSY